MRLVIVTEPLIVASRGLWLPRVPGVSSGSLAATLCTDPAIGRFFPCPVGDRAEAKVHATCGLTWSVAILLLSPPPPSQIRTPRLVSRAVSSRLLATSR
jgi:hypothetical protein